MSSDEEDLDMNEESLPPLDNQSEDGEQLDTEDILDQSQPSPSLQEVPSKRQVNLTLAPELAHAASFDITPLAAAIHPNAIYSLAATRCFRWVFTGSDDGYIRKWDFFASINGKTPLTQAQRHQFADSISLAGVISSWWENDEQPEPVIKMEPNGTDVPDSPASSISTSNVPTVSKETKLSPVYSMAVQSEALWGLQGMESGAVHLTTIRHDEGKCHHVFRKHTAPVSVLTVTPGETSFLSGSWDKQIVEWDLQQGGIIRQYNGHIAQLASATDSTEELWDQKHSNVFLTASIDGQCLLWDRRADKEAAKLPLPDKTPPWCLSACWNADGSKIYVGRRNGIVQEYDAKQMQLIQSLRMPVNSGPVYNVAALPNGKHIVCASHDNIRLWNTSVESSFTIRPDTPANQEVAPTEAVKQASSKSVIPFTIVPGHHGGVTSQILIDPTCRYMITTSGNRGWNGTATNSCLFYDISSIVDAA
ncbi:WD40-repeat-containing domain protein [Gongronella butleri]|nr:WD40-repeat-containing domain protein [Gongronella butleri]